jgi:amino acid transporter
MILKKAYGKGTMTAAASLLMAFSMIINESLVARTFGTYTLQLFDVADNSYLVPLLGVVLLIIAFLVNISGNNFIGKSSLILAIIKIGGITIFAIGGLWATGFSLEQALPQPQAENYSIASYLGAFALSILAFKGFTTITNSGGEITNPHKNVGRAIIISLAICLVIYLLVSLAVSVNLSIPKIIEAKDYALAEASRPAFGKYGLWFTVGIAIIATVSGIIASIFAVSRMTAMLTDMKLIPHSHFGMPGGIQKHMLVYTVVIAIILTVFFDLSRIASLGAIFYLVMDIGIHWGVLRHLRKEVKAKAGIVITAIILDVIVLGAFLWVKGTSDVLVVIVSVVLMALIFIAEHWFLKTRRESGEDE